MPAEVAYLWEWFMELERVRCYNEVGPQPLTYSELDAWARMTGRAPSPAEVDALLALDLTIRGRGD